MTLSEEREKDFFMVWLRRFHSTLSLLLPLRIIFHLSRLSLLPLMALENHGGPPSIPEKPSDPHAGSRDTSQPKFDVWATFEGSGAP